MAIETYPYSGTIHESTIGVGYWKESNNSSTQSVGQNVALRFGTKNWLTIFEPSKVKSVVFSMPYSDSSQTKTIFSTYLYVAPRQTIPEDLTTSQRYATSTKTSGASSGTLTFTIPTSKIISFFNSILTTDANGNYGNIFVFGSDNTTADKEFIIVESFSVTVETIEGSAYVYQNGTWYPATPYIYYNGKWYPAVSMRHNGSTFEELSV